MHQPWAFIWWVTEFTGIGLGRLAPIVFERMIGSKGHRIKSHKGTCR